MSYTYNVGEVTISDAAGDASRYFFDANGLLAKSVDPLGNTSFATYDASFNLTSVTGPTGLTTSYTYDLNGNLTSTTDPLGLTTSYTYTGPDNLLASVTNAQGATTSYTYNASGDLTSTQYPDNSISTATYDALGDPLSLTDANGQVTGYTYNAAGQVASVTLAGGTAITYAYDAQGNLISATDSSGTTTLTYDSGDRLTSVSYPNGLSLSYSYNAGGQRTQMVERSGSTVTETVNYAYTNLGQLAGLTDVSGKPIISYTYNKIGELTREDKADGTYTVYTYDADGNILTLYNDAANGSVDSSFVYTYSTLGEETSMATIDGTWTYSYDNDGQLVHAVFASTDPSIPSQDLTYVYNAAGDRTQTIINGVTSTYASNSVNEYTTVTSPDSSTTYQYNANGDMVSMTDASGTTTYAYDSLNRLVSVTSPTDSWVFQYDALGNLAATIHDGQTTEDLVDPIGLGELVGQYSGTGNLGAGYTYGLGLVSQVTPSAANYYDFSAAGTTVGLTDAASGVIASYAYLPFGGLLSSSGDVTNPFTFVGAAGVIDDGNELLDMRNRSYDPGAGQFLSNDPIGLAGGDTNFRRYVGNDPIIFVDPSGLAAAGASTIGSSAVTTQALDAATTQAGAGGVALKGAGTGSSMSAQALQAWENEVLSRLEGPQSRSVSPEPIEVVCKPLSESDTGYGFFSGSLGSTTMCNQTTGIPVKPYDPNAMIGPTGYGAGVFVPESALTLYPYQIDFENSPTATAPAQQVVITDPLDPNLDLSTFQLTDIGFGNIALSIPPGTQDYQATVPMTENGVTFDVVISASLDYATRTLTVKFESIDPQTQLPPELPTGFLPPEDGTGRGQGYVGFMISPKPGLPTGTQIRNIANIVFDGYPPIATDLVNDEDPSKGIDPTKQALITIDNTTPASSVNPLPATETSTSFTVSWAGSDGNGSGIADYNVYVSDDGGPFDSFQMNTTATSATFTGQAGHTYSFISVATSNVGLDQPAPSIGQATTTVSATATSPRITWSNPADIVYGTPLGTAELDATASVPGTFTYSVAAGTVLHAGQGQTLSVIFTPTDAVDYATVTATAILNVARATPEITWSNPADIVAGTALGAAQLDATASVPGTFSYSPSTGAVPPVGAGQRLSVTFMPSDTVDYTTVTTTTTLNVLQAAPAPFVSVASVRDVTNKKRQVTEIIVTFSGAVNAAEADDPALYRLTLPGKKGSYTARNAEAIKLRSAFYDAVDDTVTLIPKKPFALTKPVQLVIDGRPPSGLQDGSGRFIDGGRIGTAGSNGVAILSRGGARIEAVAAGAAGGQAGGIMAVVDALFERDAFAGLTTAHRARRSCP